MTFPAITSGSSNLDSSYRNPIDGTQAVTGPYPSIFPLMRHEFQEPTTPNLRDRIIRHMSFFCTACDEHIVHQEKLDRWFSERPIQAFMIAMVVLAIYMKVNEAPEQSSELTREREEVTMKLVRTCLTELMLCLFPAGVRMYYSKTRHYREMKQQGEALIVDLKRADEFSQKFFSHLSKNLGWSNVASENEVSGTHLIMHYSTFKKSAVNP